MKKILLILILAHLAVADLCLASELYSGSVAVSSQGEEDRRDAIPDALIQVLQKLSGLHDIPVTTALDEALNNAQRFLTSYRYEIVDRTGADGEITRDLRLVANFIPTEIDRLVQRAALPRWRQERPPVQIWVIVDDGIRRNMKPLEYDYAWEALEKIAAVRGLPVTWPELDEEERQLIDMRLVWGGYTDYLVERGAPADGVAIIAIRREGPNWTLRWNVANDVRAWSWRTSDRDLVFALADGVHTMTDEIAASQSIAASEQGTTSLDLTIAGLNSSENYIRCMEYLKSVSLVTRVDILGANPGRVHFRLQLNAAAEYLAEAFRLGTVLLPAGVNEDYDYVFIQ